MNLEWRDRNGNRQGSLRDVLLYNQIRISPDGLRIAISRLDSKGALDIWLYQINRDAWTRFTFGDGTDTDPVWSPDSKMIAYSSDIKGVVDIYLRPSSGAGAEEVILETSVSKIPTDWSRDGKFIAYHSQPGNFSNRDIWILPMSSSGKKSDRKSVV